MRTNLFRPRNKGDRSVTSAAAVQYECRDYVKQMALPFVPQRRVKGALGIVSRESGVSYSKVRKIYYGLTDHILAFEFRSIAEAYKRHVVREEARLTEELEHLKTLRGRLAQHDLDLQTHTRGDFALDDAKRN